MATTRSAHPADLWPGIKTHFGDVYDEIPTQWDKVFQEETSDKAYEKVVEATGFGLASVKTEGGSVAYDTDAEGITNTLTHVVYGLGYIVTQEEIDDNQYKDKSERRARGLAYSMRQTAEIVHANILNRAFSASYTFGDGVALCSASHVTRSGNQSNLLTAADLSESALEDAQKAVWAMKNARDLKINAGIKRLIVHTDDAFNAERILKTQLRSGTANNDINALRSMGTIPEIMAYRFLTDSDAWFIQTDVPEGLLSYWRRKVELRKDMDFDTDNAKAKAQMRFATGFGDWRCLYGSAGA